MDSRICQTFLVPRHSRGITLFIYRSLGWRDIYNVLVESAEIASAILTIVALASVFAWASSTLGTFERLAQAMLSAGMSETLTLLSILLLILIAGMFIDVISMFFIFLPLLVPIAMHFNWDLVWFGVLITMDMALGQFHPPLGVNLIVTCRMANITMESTIIWSLWFVAAMGGAMLLVAFVPELALWLPRVSGYL